jgi:hypothetical protein
MFKRIVLCAALITFEMVLSLNAQPQPSPVQSNNNAPRTRGEKRPAAVIGTAGLLGATRVCCPASVIFTRAGSPRT